MKNIYIHRLRPHIFLVLPDLQNCTAFTVDNLAKPAIRSKTRAVFLVDREFYPSSSVTDPLMKSRKQLVGAIMLT